MHRSQPFPYFAQRSLDRRTSLHVSPPRCEIWTPFQWRPGGEDRKHRDCEEYRWRQRAVGQGKVISGGEAACGQHRVELIEAQILFGQLLVEQFFVAVLRIELRGQRLLRQRQVEIVEAGKD